MTTGASIERARPLPFAVIDISMGLLVKGATVNCWNTDKSVRYSAPIYCMRTHTHARAYAYIGDYIYIYISTSNEKKLFYNVP